MTLLQAIRNACADCGLELRPEADAGRVEDALTLAGFQLSVDPASGRLCATQNGFPCGIGDALKTLSRKREFDDVFETPLDRVTKISQLRTNARKVGYIRMHGLGSYEVLVGQKQ